jgi:pullulanase/glycogen debranching enzyme
VEGPTDDPAILAARRQTRRNLLATLLLAQGVPMLLAGDELGRTQGGNNNAYCQDNEVSWLDWQGADRELLALVQGLVALRRAHPAFRRRHWLGESTGHPADWFRLDGRPMTALDWERGPVDGLQLLLDGRVPAREGPAGRGTVGGPGGETASGSPAQPGSGGDGSADHQAVEGPAQGSDATFLLVINALPEDRQAVLPPPPPSTTWQVRLDTALEQPFPPRDHEADQAGVRRLAGRSVVLLEAVTGPA